jgi:hypothetical protein
MLPAYWPKVRVGDIHSKAAIYMMDVLQKE